MPTVGPVYPIGIIFVILSGQLGLGFITMTEFATV